MHRTALVSTALLAAAALLAPAAYAQRPDDRGGMIGVGGVTASAADAVRPDDWAGMRGPGSLGSSSAPTVLVAKDGFDWGDAGIGVAGAIGFALLTAGLLAAARSHRGRGVLTGAALLVALLPASAASAEDGPGPSCNGAFSSAAAGDPGHVAEAAHFVKDLSALFGVPPGAFNSDGARTHCER